MIIPGHIFRIVEKLQDELKSLFETNPENEDLFVSLQETKQIKRELLEKDGSLFEYDDEYVIMINIMAAIYEVIPFNILPSTSIKRIFNDCQIESELEFALNHAQIAHPKMNNEICNVINFLENNLANNLRYEDTFSDYKLFKLISKIKYDEIKQKSFVTDLRPEFKYIKILYVETDTSLHLSYAAKKAKSHLIEKLGEEKFYEHINFFSRWFKLGKTRTYYIYVPK